MSEYDEAFVCGYWTDPTIVRDYAWLLNVARLAS